jgi:predicted enzyme related to lactoylglutathione lyase
LLRDSAFSAPEEVLMTEYARPRVVGFNHVALEVGDIEEALAFYGRLFRFELRGKSDTMAFIDLGDQFIALQKGRRQPADDGRHFGLVVDDKEASPLLAGLSSIFAIPGVTALRSSATTISNSPRLPMCCVGWA